MQTVLLADDERVFKALEGTCLRSEACRLVKTSPARLVEVAASRPPDLIVLSLDMDDAPLVLRGLSGSARLSSIPILALDFTGPSHARKAVVDAGDRQGVVDLLVVKKGRSGRIDLSDLDARLDEAIKRHLPSIDRRIDRVAVSVPVKCRGEGFRFTVRTKNISPSGLFLKTERTLSPGASIRVRFELPIGAGPKRAEPIAATCQVVRCVGPGGNDDLDLIPGIGVRFIDLEEDGRTALRRFVRRGSPPSTTARSAIRRAAAH